MPIRSCWWALLLVALLVFTAGASAQTSAGASLLPPQTDSFPRIRAYLDVHDAQGAFINGIQASQVTVLENSQPLPVAELELLRPGAQIVLVVNPGPPFSIRNSQGTTRYERLATALGDWAKSRRGTSIDDYSLMAANGPELTHLSDSSELVSALGSYQPEADAATPGLEILLRAIDISADTPPRPGMGRAVLLVTPPLQGDISFGVQELISRAQALRVHIFVWFVASPDALDSPSARLLSGLAQQTAGQFFTFSGDEAIPNPETYFEPLRAIYQLGYDSKIASGGAQELSVEVRQGDQVIASPPVSFNFDLQPPDPAFISPAPEILRALPAGRKVSLWEQASPTELMPKEQKLEVLVDFPDGQKRPLVRTALYVDGALEDENTAPPFEGFTWDLSGYTASGQHILQVEAQDSLGLKGSSIQVPVQVMVDLPRPNPMGSLLLRWPDLTGLAVLLVGAGVLLALVLTGRIHPHRLAMLGLRRLPRRSRPALPAARSEPTRPHLPHWVNRLQWPQRRLNPKAEAYLSFLPESAEKLSVAPISITASEITFGLDPSLASFVLDNPSVEGLHARLVRQEDGSFRLIDQGSVAGTWVNYAEVPEEGQVLQHGDLIHFGRVGFRFTLRLPQNVSKPVTTLQENQK